MDWLYFHKDELQALGPFAIAFTALVVGITTVLLNLHFNRQNTRIAASAHQVSRDRLKFELFDRRVRVYEAVVAVCVDVAREGHPSWDFSQHRRLGAVSTESYFLFGEDVHAYLKQLRDKLGEGLLLQSQMYDQQGRPVNPPGVDRGKVARDAGENTLWFYNQVEQAREVFAPYLNLRF